MAYFDWIESLVPDYRTNAKTSTACGAHYPIAPSKDQVSSRRTITPITQGKYTHHWISAGDGSFAPSGIIILYRRPDFLRNRLVPLYKDLALFYEDFLTLTDKNGNYIFVPSFSPENHPASESDVWLRSMQQWIFRYAVKCWLIWWSLVNCWALKPTNDEMENYAE